MIGTSLNQYQITARLGAGGMGEVFRARDTRLNRDVAIKVLPKDFATDADRLRRFEQESKTLASLNHPNILTIHDAGVHDGAPYLVSELLTGRTLRQEMNGAALPVRKTADYALQIARGLAAAHSTGIIHRDLKPENIFVTKDGRVKILDFGLAKLRAGWRNGSSDFKSPADPDAPTLAESTQPGMVLGTPAYMSPEQVRGEPADHRSDIFAFGCVLYEMLTGARAFRRDTPVESMNAVLTEQPPELRAAGASLPQAFESVVRRCLEKDPDNRFQSAQDLAFTIQFTSSSSTNAAQPTLSYRPGPVSGKPLFVGITLAALAFCGGLLTTRLHSPAHSFTAIRSFTYSGHDHSPSASADGKRVCFSSDRDGTRRIWVKEVASGWENPLTGGPDDFPRFSRDGSTILFTRAVGEGTDLFRVPSIGGEPFRIAANVRQADWSPDGSQVAFIRWGEKDSSSVYTVHTDGSGEALVYHFDHSSCSFPRWSPDGTKIAVAFNQGGHPQSLGVIAIRTRQITSFSALDGYNVVSGVSWAAGSHGLYYMQAESVAADTSGSTAVFFHQPFTRQAFRKLLWSPVMGTVLDPLPSGNFLFDARSSRQNLNEYAIGSGSTVAHSLTLGSSTDRQPAYSPSGEEIVFTSNRSGNMEIWSVSRKTGKVRRLTEDPADDWDPAFSPDGRSLIWSSKRSGNLEIWMANSDGSAPHQVTHDGFAAQNPTMTKDCRWIVYASHNPKRAGLWKIHPDGTGDTRLIPSLTTMGNAEVSPDGRYAAYRDFVRDPTPVIKVLEVESGTKVPFEIQLKGIKETPARLGRVRWMPDGKALAFLGQNEAGVNGVYVQDFVPGKDTTESRRPLGPFDPENSAESFGISPDGQFITISTWEQSFSIMVTEGLDDR